MTNSARICVIGAGPCGLAAAKNLKQLGLAFDCYEREDDVGGNWYFGRPSSSVYKSTHLISSKRLTEYTDFPMPNDYPHYPSHAQVLAYLRLYAKQFGLDQDIRFNTSVERVERADGGWHVTLRGESSPRPYAAVVIANGHHWDPQRPEYPGTFEGESIHSRDYKTPAQLAGRRALVIGAGNSGCDIAVEAAQHAQAVFMSLRRGYHFLPKFLFGKPVDECGEGMHRLHMPLWVRRFTAALTARVSLGPPYRNGLPRPDHKLFESHPIVNSQLAYYLGHGSIKIKPNVAELAGTRVRFTDGSEEEIDLVVYATGYKLSFPFIDLAHLNPVEGRPRLFMNAFHPACDDLFVIGMIQADSGLWGLADLQAQIMAAYLAGRRAKPESVAWFSRLKAENRVDLANGIRYLDTPRHFLEVEYFSYRQRLRSLVKRLRKSTLEGSRQSVTP